MHNVRSGYCSLAEKARRVVWRADITYSKTFHLVLEQVPKVSKPRESKRSRTTITMNLSALPTERGSEEKGPTKCVLGAQPTGRYKSPALSLSSPTSMLGKPMPL